MPMKISKLVTLGDSITKGYGVENNQTWVSLLQIELKAKIVNSGISGDTSGGMLARFKTMVLDHEPSHVLIMCGTNDVLCNIPNEQIIANILAMSRYAKYHNIKVVIGLPPLSYLVEEESIFITSSEANLKIINYRNVLEQFCVHDELLYIDFSLGLEQNNYMSDGLHPNEKGHAIMKENVLRLLG